MFNSTVSEEPYQGMTLPCKRTETCDLRGWATGAARLSSARVVRCSLKWENERNPRDMLIFISDCQRLSWRKVGMTSNQRGSYALGDTRATMGRAKGRQTARWSKSYKYCPQFGSRAATRPREAGTRSNRRSTFCGEYAPAPCTHRPSNHLSRVQVRAPHPGAFKLGLCKEG